MDRDVDVCVQMIFKYMITDLQHTLKEVCLVGSAASCVLKYNYSCIFSYKIFIDTLQLYNIPEYKSVCNVKP